jgi:hypothetical protein
MSENKFEKSVTGGKRMAALQPSPVFSSDRTGETRLMLTHIPKAVPEIPVSNVVKAAECYVRALGFHFDWGTVVGGRPGRGSLLSRRTNRGICASSGSPIRTVINCACSTTFPGKWGRSKEAEEHSGRTPEKETSRSFIEGWNSSAADLRGAYYTSQIPE